MTYPLRGAGTESRGTWNTAARSLGEDMPRKPLDVVTRIILCHKEQQCCSPAYPARSGVWGCAPRKVKAPHNTVLMFLIF